MGDSTSSRERLPLAISALAPVLAALATVPVVEMGINDDFSYTFIARRLAETGQLQYDGWATTMVGAMAWWAALLIRLFGFSFTLVRLSTLPFAAGCGLLVYLLGRRAGLDRAFALFGSLVITISPLFIPLAASFMTDVPGLFFWLLSIWSALIAADQTSTTRAAMLLLLCAFAGVLGGTIRQVVWIAPMIAIPISARLVHRRLGLAGISAVAAVLWCATAVSAWLCLRWFNSQPYAQLQNYAVTPADAFSLDTLRSTVRLFYGVIFFLLPVLLMFLSGLRQWRAHWRGALAGAALMTALLAAFILLYPEKAMTGNIVGPAGIMSSDIDVMGGKPTILTPPIVFVIRIFMWFGGVAAILGYFAHPLRIDARQRNFAFLCIPAALAYLGAVLYRSLDAGSTFDRYLLEVLPLLVIALLTSYQDQIRRAIPATGWACFAVFALYGIAVTHDAFGADRARVKAANSLTTQGIPRTHITAGLEYDGWTQLAGSGYINAPDIDNPVDAYKDQDDRKYPISPPYWFWSFTPSIDPAYFITYQPVAGLRESTFPPIPFTTWLPPFGRRVRILTVAR